MKRFAARTLLAMSFISFSVVGASAGTSASLETSVQSAQKSLEQRSYKRAETTLRKALDAAATAGTKDAATAGAQLLLATVLREAGKASEASEALAQSYAIYKSLGFVDPKYVEESKSLADNFQRIDVALLGSASNVLRNNAAEVSITKSTAGGHVEIKIAAPFETTLNNPKVDGVQLEKLVSFDIESSQPGAIHVSNIKGFKIHSIEKNTWANLLDLKTGALDSEGKYDAEVTAGKAGFTKTVAAKLPGKVYEPVEALSKQLSAFGTVVAVDLPVVPPTAAIVATPATSAVPEMPHVLPVLEATQARPISEAVKPIVEQPAQPVYVEPKPVAVEQTPVVEAQPVVVEEVKPANVVQSKPVVVQKQPVVEPQANSDEETKPVAAEKTDASGDCYRHQKVKTSGAHQDNDNDDDDDDDDNDDNDSDSDSDKKDDNKKDKGD